MTSVSFMIPRSNFAIFASFAVKAFDRKGRKDRKGRLSGYNAALHQFQRLSKSNLAQEFL